MQDRVVTGLAADSANPTTTPMPFEERLEVGLLSWEAGRSNPPAPKGGRGVAYFDLGVRRVQI